jgi:serine/threonine-protein kinase RsbW
MERTGSLTLTIDSRLEDVYLIGLTVNKLCSVAALSQLETYQVEVSVVEAVNNAIEHGYGCEPGHPIEVRITLEEHSLSFEISDQGIAMPAGAAAAPPTPTAGDADLAEGGRGLFIMESFMDAVIYEQHGGRNVRTLVKRLAAQD